MYEIIFIKIPKIYLCILYDRTRHQNEPYHYIVRESIESNSVLGAILKIAKQVINEIVFIVRW